MPYIAKEDRKKYIFVIENTVDLICSEKDKHAQLETLAFFVDHLRQKLDHGYPSFKIDFLDPNQKEQLLENINHFISLFPENDLFKLAGELNYILSSVIWGVLGDSLSAEPARYGYRTFIKGILWTIYHGINGAASDRLVIVLRGVFTDVIDEMYRRKTSVYENEKIAQNGDIWPLKEIAWKEEVPIDVIRGEEFKEEQES
ncbi:MAG: hypothetical protein DWQ19_11035 [Crenarchaeota archaeon]|nr:MAG: hypothetical protein DWQ19_11035 [Thermoproteota archaeon]